MVSHPDRVSVNIRQTLRTSHCPSQRISEGGEGGSTWENKPVLKAIFHLHSESRLRVGEAFPLLPHTTWQFGAL